MSWLRPDQRAPQLAITDPNSVFSAQNLCSLCSNILFSLLKIFFVFCSNTSPRSWASISSRWRLRPWLVCRSPSTPPPTLPRTTLVFFLAQSISFCSKFCFFLSFCLKSFFLYSKSFLFCSNPVDWVKPTIISRYRVDVYRFPICLPTMCPLSCLSQHLLPGFVWLAHRQENQLECQILKLDRCICLHTPTRTVSNEGLQLRHRVKCS